ncbi:hypothetical protein J7643_03400 [bacterium]|nr:hypothetical protein [bacterium]
MRYATLALACALLLAAMPMTQAAPLTNVGRLERLLTELTQDQPLDAAKFDRLILAALTNDLLIDREEAAFLTRSLDHAGPDGFVDEAPDVSATFEGVKPSGWVARAQQILVRTLKASTLNGPTATALQQLGTIALRSDLDGKARDQILTLIANYRRVATTQVTRDPLEAIEAVLIDPEGALRTAEHRRQLELLDRRGNMPSMLRGREASGSTRP